MSEKNIVFSENAYRQLQDAVRRLEREVAALQKLVGPTQRYNQQAPGYYCKAEGTITGMNGDTYGGGTVGIYRPEKSGSDWVVGTKIFEQEVLNTAGQIANNRPCCIQPFAWGHWSPTVENCPE